LSVVSVGYMLTYCQLEHRVTKMRILLQMSASSFTDNMDRQPVVAHLVIVGMLVYRSSVRTNDVEGWHNRLNSRCHRGNLDLYQLAPILFKEASYVSLQASLVSEARLRRHQRKTYQRLQGRLAAVWSAYAAGQLTTSALLRKCLRIYAVA